MNSTKKDIFTCPQCNKTVEDRTRWSIDEDTGVSKYGGNYLACPNAYKRSAEADCDYSVSMSPRRDGTWKLSPQGDVAWENGMREGNRTKRKKKSI